MHGARSLWRTGSVCGVLVPAVLFAACGWKAAEQTACAGLADKTIGITKTDYAACAGEILSVLDALESPLRRLVLKEEAAARPEAEAAYRRLRHLMRQVGFQADVWREAREGAGRTIERWPVGAMRYFNTEVGVAAAQYISALRHPNPGNLQEGSRRHEQARRAYSHFR